MSDDEFHGYLALLVFSSLVLSVVAVRGFGLSKRARAVDGVFSVAFLGYAGHLLVADPDTVLVSYYAFAAPFLAVLHALRHRRAPRTVQTVHGHGRPTGFHIDPVPTPPPAVLAYIERMGGGPAAALQPDDDTSAYHRPAEILAGYGAPGTAATPPAEAPQQAGPGFLPSAAPARKPALASASVAAPAPGSAFAPAPAAASAPAPAPASALAPAPASGPIPGSGPAQPAPAERVVGRHRREVP